MLSEPFIVNNSLVFLIDTEGIGSATESDLSHDAKILSLAYLLSAFFVYNIKGNIGEEAMTTMASIQSLAKDMISLGEEGMGSLPKPECLWLIRDFFLELGDLSEDQYLQQCFEPRNGTSPDTIARNTIRVHLQDMFRSHKIHTMVSKWFDSLFISLKVYE